MTTSIPSAETLFSFEQEINAIRDDALSKVGQADADYIRRVIRWQRALDLLSRLVIVLGFIHPLFWVAGVLMLALAKILDNMEIGHNVMHGQYDWMNDPHINSRAFKIGRAQDLTVIPLSAGFILAFFFTEGVCFFGKMAAENNGGRPQVTDQVGADIAQ